VSTLPSSVRDRRLQTLKILEAASSAGLFDWCRSEREAECQVEDLLGEEYEDMDVEPRMDTSHIFVTRARGETDEMLRKRLRFAGSGWTFTVNGSKMEDFK